MLYLAGVSAELCYHPYVIGEKDKKAMDSVFHCLNMLSVALNVTPAKEEYRETC